MPSSSETPTGNPARELAAIMFSDIAGYTAIMGRDEHEAVRALAAHRDLLRSLLPRFNGRMAGEIGDGTLSSFHSAVDAVNCACELQAHLKDRPELSVRIGIHVGDVLLSGSTVIGDGVNVASRIHALAEPGGICISERVYEEIRNKPEIQAKYLGEKHLKNVARPVRAWALTPTGERESTRKSPVGRALGAVTSTRRPRIIAAATALLSLVAGFAYAPIRTEVLASAILYLPRILPNQFNRYYFEQKLGFCTTSDGVRIAYGTAGQGPPVVFVITWATHLEHGVGSGTYGSLPFTVLGASHMTVQYDGRGFGASDRGVRDFSLDARLRDLEAVVDALKLKRFALWGLSAGGPITIAYAARHPERVTRLVLQETFAKLDFDLMTAEERDRLQPFFALARNSWSNTGFLDLFASQLWPDGTEVQWRVVTDMFRISGTPEDLGNFFSAQAQDLDTTSLARQIRVPTLIVHIRNDQIIPLELGKHLAALIPGSRLVIIEGRNHATPYGSNEFEQSVQAIRPFMDQDRTTETTPKAH